MLPEWRLVKDDIYEVRHHFAMEEALARLVDEGHTPPTLRLRQVYPSVFIGVHQNTWTEVDVEYCRAHDIQIVRRMNGGGAIYHEMGSFCFSAFFRRDLFTQSEDELYQLFAQPVIRTCADYGVSARYVGRNDVLVGDRKIYGCAHFSWYHAHVQSGTFLVNMNFEAMANVLTPPAIKFSGKSIQNIQERVTSLSLEVGQVLDTREVMERFTGHVSEVLGIQLIADDLTDQEKLLAKELLKAKYSTESWNFGSKLEFQLTVADRTDEGVLSLSADLEGKIIQKARITGDILRYHRNDLDTIEHIMMGCTIQDVQASLQDIPLYASFRETILRLLEKLDQQAAEVSTRRLRETRS